MTIHLLTIEHRHGTDHWACATEEIALCELDKYVIRWWHSEVSDEAIPEDRNLRIAAYFDAVGDSSHPEYYSIAKYDVI